MAGEAAAAGVEDLLREAEGRSALAGELSELRAQLAVRRKRKSRETKKRKRMPRVGVDNTAHGWFTI